MKRIAWTVFLAVGSAAGAALTARALNAVWRGVTHEAPPETPWWARWFVGKPVQVGVRGAIGDAGT